MLQRRSRRLHISIFAIAILLCALSVAAASRTFDPGPYLHSQRLIDIGGRRLNMYCTGTGSPTVVLDEGLGGTTADWRFVQPAIARTTRVCSYDRAGMGFSDRASPPRDASAAVSDLHALLARAGIAPPLVLVGHSIAGLYDRLYADRYLSDIAGMVLVDPGYPYQTRDLAKISPVYAHAFESRNTLFEKCYTAATNHTLKPNSSLFTECGLLDAAGLRKQCATESPAACKIDVLQNDQSYDPALWEGVVSEMSAFGAASSAQVQKEQRDYGKLPLIVLTRGKTNFKSPKAPISSALDRALWKQWDAAHARIAALSSAGTNLVVAGSGHYIQIDRPAAVISAIARVVTKVRSTGNVVF